MIYKASVLSSSNFKHTKPWGLVEVVYSRTIPILKRKHGALILFRREMGDCGKIENLFPSIFNFPAVLQTTPKSENTKSDNCTRNPEVNREFYWFS